MKCKLCGTQEVNSVKKIKSPYVNFRYTLYQCNTCKNRFFDFNEHNVDIQMIYEESAANYIKITRFRKNFYWRNQIRRIEKHLGKEPKSVLDVGCRTGDFLMNFPNNIVREGVELSKNLAEIAKKRELVLYHDFVENINFDKQYDVVTCYAILEHLIDPLIFLNKLADIVSSEGIVVIMIPTYECLKRWMIDTFTSIRWHMYAPPLHLNLFSKQFLDRCLAENNFKLVDRYWASGGMFNPLKNFPFVNRVFGKFIALLDEYTPINEIPIFDHLYSYYVKTR